MSENKTTGEIYKAIAAIMSEITPIAKGQRNVEQKFNFRGIDDIYNSVHAIMAKHGVFTIPSIIGRERHDVTSNAGKKGIHIINHYRFRFFAKDGSYVDAEADGEGIDYGDKASNKCASIAHKYAILQVFMIPTADLIDPDSESPDMGSATVEAPAPRPVMQTARPAAPAPSRPQAVKPAPTIGDTLVPFGRSQGKTLNSLSDGEIGSLQGFYDRLREQGEEPKGRAKTFKALLDAYLATKPKNAG